MIEAAERVLPALPPRLSRATREPARQAGRARCTPAPACDEVLRDGVRLADGRLLPAGTGGLGGRREGARGAEGAGRAGTNRLTSSSCVATLQTTRDDDVFADRRLRRLSLSGPRGTVPPRARPRTSRRRTCAGRSVGGWRGGAAAAHTPTATSAGWCTLGESSARSAT